jgi:hypothetical protein
MLTWLVATVGAIALAVVPYLWRERRAPSRLAPLMALRAVALTILLALVFDAPSGRPRAPAALVALDASLSWTRAHGDSAWRSVADRARELARGAGNDSIILFGDSARTGRPPEQPADLRTDLSPLVQRALGAGRPAIVLTDGEIDDPESLRDLPAGSRVEIPARDAEVDLAPVAIEAPRAFVGGDTVDMRVTLRAGAGAVASATLTVALDGRLQATARVDSIPAQGERTVALRIPVNVSAGPAILSAVVNAGGDAERRNDSLLLAVDVSRAAGAVLASTSPDLDARYLIPILRGSVSLPTRAYFRVAPGQWRVEGALTPVSESEVRRALHDAPLAILHGDTSLFGNPRVATTGALTLIAPPTDTSGEWFAVAAPMSPIVGALGSIPWDSLAPLQVAATLPTLGWEGLIAARARQFDRRAAITGTAVGRRVVVVGASGFWRWRVRGGVESDTYAALWGSIFDWLTAERVDLRGAVPAEGIVRAGERLRWRRGGTDSVVAVRIRKRGGSVSDSMMIRFSGGAVTAESAPLAQGVYEIGVSGGNALLAVNAPREMLPRTPTVRAGPVGGAALYRDQPRLRDRSWPYVIVLLALCAEWLLRRRLGLR